MKAPLKISFIEIKSLSLNLQPLISLLDENHVLVLKAQAQDFFLHTDQFLSFMSPLEKSRLQHISIKIVARRYLIYRGLLRFLLGAIIDSAPQDMELAVGPYGKPSLKSRSNHDDLAFNLSHADDTVIYAFSKYGEIGVDIERKDAKFSSIEVADLILTENEKKHVLALSLLEQMPFLIELWTKKEAVSKAFGCGLNMDFKSLELGHLNRRTFSQFKVGKDYCCLNNISSLPDFYAHVALIDNFHTA